MTYRELFYKATRLIDKGEITLGEYDEMTKPLDREIEQQPCIYSTKDGYCQYDDISETIPPLEPCDDAVSRKAVDELSKELVHTTRDKADFLCNFWEGLQKLPPVIPQALKQQPCDDAISRQAAINIASLHCLTIDETVKAINSLPSVTQKSAKDYLDMADRKAKKIKDALIDNSQKYGKWIDIDEQKPDVGISVLVCDDEEDIYLTHITRDGVFFDEWGNKIKGIVAWMPLPESYKGE